MISKYIIEIRGKIPEEIANNPLNLDIGGLHHRIGPIPRVGEEVEGFFFIGELSRTCFFPVNMVENDRVYLGFRPEALTFENLEFWENGVGKWTNTSFWNKRRLTLGKDYSSARSETLRLFNRLGDYDVGFANGNGRYTEAPATFRGEIPEIGQQASKDIKERLRLHDGDPRIKHVLHKARGLPLALI